MFIMGHDVKVLLTCMAGSLLGEDESWTNEQ